MHHVLDIHSYYDVVLYYQRHMRAISSHKKAASMMAGDHGEVSQFKR